MKELFKNKSYNLLFVGSLVSEIGNALFLFAVGLYILDVTGSGLSMSLFLAIGIGVRVLASPIAGVLVDRWNRVRVIYITDFIRGCVFVFAGIIIFSEINPTESIILLYIVSGIGAVSAAFFDPAVKSAIPDIVGEDILQEALGAQNIVGGIQSIIGLLTGAIIYTLLGIEWVLVINAVSFLLSGFSEMFIKTKYKKAPQEHTEGYVKSNEKTIFGDFKFGIKYLISTEGLFTYVLFSLTLNFAIAPMLYVGIPYLFNTQLGRPPIELASMQIMYAAVTMIGGFIVGGIKIKNASNTIGGSFILISIGFMGYALSSYYISNGYISYLVFYCIFLGLMAIVSTGLVIAYVIMLAGMIKAITPNVRGRVFSTTGALSQSCVPIALIFGGLIIDNSSVTILSVFCSILFVIPTIGFLMNKKVKKLINGF